MAEWISRCPNGHESMTFDTHCGVCGEVVTSHRAGQTPARPQAPIFVRREPSNPPSLFGERTCSNGHKIDSIDLFCGVCGEEVDAAAPPLAVMPKPFSVPTSDSSSFDSVSTQPDPPSENLSCVRGHTATPVDTHCRVCGKQLKPLRPTGLDRSGPAPQASGNRATQRPRWIKAFGRRHKKVIQVAALVIFGVTSVLGAFFAGQAIRSGNQSKPVWSPAQQSTDLMSVTPQASTVIGTTTTPVACPSDASSLKEPVRPHSDSEAFLQTQVRPGSIKYVMGTKYVRFTLEPTGNFGIQTVGVFLRCDSGSWTYMTIIDGESCWPNWTGDDYLAAVAIEICP
jgi:hypothetical protein